MLISNLLLLTLVEGKDMVVHDKCFPHDFFLLFFLNSLGVILENFLEKKLNILIFNKKGPNIVLGRQKAPLTPCSQRVCLF